MNPSKAPWYFSGLQEMLGLHRTEDRGASVMPSILMVA
jgi:hypothetical protein